MLNNNQIYQEKQNHQKFMFDRKELKRLFYYNDKLVFIFIAEYLHFHANIAFIQTELY